MALAVVGVALAPAWINLQAVRSRIAAAASSALGGAVAYERIDLSWLPRPEAVLRSADVSVPGVARGQARSVRVAFAFLPLLRGRFVPSHVRVDGLDAFFSRPDGRGIWVEGVRAEASGGLLEGKKDVAVQLSVESPRLGLEGVVRWDASAPRAELAVRGSLDGDSVRTALLALAGDDRTIAEIFAIFRGGRLTSFSFESVAPAPSDLFALERMKIRAKVEDARLRIEGPGLNLEDVSADVALEGGVLSAEGAKARLGSSRAEGGRVLVGLVPGDGRLRVEAAVRADVSEVPAVLARAVPSLREDLALVSRFAGRARGKLVIGDCAGALGATVLLDEMRFSGTHERIPWPAEVRQGRFSLQGSRLALTGLEGALGRSTFSNLTARLHVGGNAVIEQASGSVHVSLEDFLEGARSIPGADVLAKRVARLAGVAHVDVQRIAGPLARLGEASLNASGTFEGILFEGFSLPVFSIASGRFAVNDGEIRVDGAEARTMDASLRVSGALHGWRGGTPALEAAVDGEVGPDAVRWTWSRASLPVDFRPAAPVAVRNARVTLAGEDALSLGGDFTLGSHGPRVLLELSRSPSETDVRRLSVEHGDSAATMALRKRGSTWDLDYEGRLDVATVAGLFEDRRPHRGAIEGAFRARVPAGNLRGSTAEGRLVATDLDVPTPAGTVTVERLEARAGGSRFDVGSSALVLEGQRLTAAGSASLNESGIALDLNVDAGDAAWTTVEKVLENLRNDAAKDLERKPGESARASPVSGGTPFALSGVVRTSIGSFSYGKLTWTPVLADVRLGANTVAALLRKADICGISTTGSATIATGGRISLQAVVESQGEDINVPLTCLGFENVRMTGGYEASVRAEGEGAPAELLGALRGPVTFRAFKGGIGKATVLTRLLAVLNTTDVFGGKSKVGDSIAYDTLALSGDLEEGRLAIREAALKSPSLTMAATGAVDYRNETFDVMVLSHPLSGVDKVVQAVPVVRTILGKEFLAVAASVTGPLEDPKVTITPARDVGKYLVNVMERTVTLPVKVLDPKSQ